jgi:hypothetical protein
MLLVYTQKVTHRNKYTFNLIFKDILGIDWKQTTDPEELKNYTGPKLSYALNPVADELFFQGRSLLFETGIKEQEIVVTEYNGCKIFFPAGKSSVFPFDPFAASFYLVSRYEEYLPHIRDEYDRFDAKVSLAYQHGFLTRPVVNIWAGWIRDAIKARYPEQEFPQQHYKYISTIDIDNAYAYKEKGFMRTVGGYLRSLINFNFKEAGLRTRVLLGTQRDPYDTYHYMLDIQKRYKLKPIYFFLLGDYGINDKNLPIDNRSFQSLIKRIGDYAQVGIHPSFGSNEDPSRLKTEILRLSKILHREVTRSRQHFLKLKLPITYRNLIDLDITDDYTMGYASSIGFRAGTCTSFNFYDLDLELETKLKLHPFAVMDATLKYYMKLEPADAIAQVKPLIEEVKAVNGTFISLWHNETLSDEKQWAGWREVYEEIVKAAAEGSSY